MSQSHTTSQPHGAVFHQVIYDHALNAVLGLRGALDVVGDVEAARVWARMFGSAMVSLVVLSMSFWLIFPEVRVIDAGKAVGEEPTDNDQIIEMVADARRRIGDYSTVEWIGLAPDLVRGLEDTLRRLEDGQTLGSVGGNIFARGVPDSPDSAEPPPQSTAPSPADSLLVPGLSRSSSSGSSAPQGRKQASRSPAAVQFERPVRERPHLEASQPAPSFSVTPPPASVSLPAPVRGSPMGTSPTSTSPGAILAPSQSQVAQAVTSSAGPIVQDPSASTTSVPSSAFTFSAPPTHAASSSAVPTVAAEATVDETSGGISRKSTRRKLRAVSFHFFYTCPWTDPSFQCKRCREKRVRCTPSSEDVNPIPPCTACVAFGIPCLREDPAEGSGDATQRQPRADISGERTRRSGQPPPLPPGEAVQRHRTTDYSAPPGSPPAGSAPTVPYPPDLFHHVARDVPLYGNKDAPLRDLLFWYEEVTTSRRESVDSRAVHEAAIAAMNAAKRAFDASVIIEGNARDRVHRADKRCRRANVSYADMSSRVFLKDKGVSDPAGVEALRKRRNTRVKARSLPDPKGKGKERAIDIDIDEELEAAREEFGSGGEEQDNMELDN